MSDQELTWKQKVFCKAYLSNGFNGKQAAITAGYSKDSATVIASENLSKPYLQEFIEKHMQEIENKLEMTVEWKLKKLKNCINGSMDDSDENNVNIKNHNAFLGAMAESSKLQGHYKEKAEVENKLDEMNDKLNELRAQYRKDY